MMSFKKLNTVFFAVLPLVCCSHLIAESSNGQNLSEKIADVDRFFWEAYNRCDTQKMAEFVTDDVEFYHDKEGLILGKAALIKTVKSNLCADNDFQLRRVGNEATQAIFPIHQYGAIMTGKHSFYSRTQGQEEHLDSTAAFTHIWQKHEDQWKMSRIMSYAHAVAGQPDNKVGIAIVKGVLLNYSGRYQAAHTGAITVEQYQSGLRISAAESSFDVLPESETVFFHSDSPLSFEFVKNAAGATTKMYIRENGNIVEEAIREE